MRIQLAAAVALAPLMMASGAAAQTVISNERTTPIATATANNGSPDSIRIGNGGVIRLGSGVAITVNSSNNVTIDAAGRIVMENAADGSTGILINGGYTTDVTHGGQILVTDSFTATDTDNDGDLDGAFATGTGRFGIRAVGPGAVDGDITSTGSITVEGNNSAGISVETGLNGNLFCTGALRFLVVKS